MDIDYALANSDCLEYIKGIPDKSIDLILTDPPYNIAQYSTGNIPLPGRTAINNDLGEWDLKEINPFDFVDEFKRILKPAVCLPDLHSPSQYFQVLHREGLPQNYQNNI